MGLGCPFVPAPGVPSSGRQPVADPPATSPTFYRSTPNHTWRHMAKPAAVLPMQLWWREHPLKRLLPSSKTGFGSGSDRRSARRRPLGHTRPWGVPQTCRSCRSRRRSAHCERPARERRPATDPAEPIWQAGGSASWSLPTIPVRLGFAQIYRIETSDSAPSWGSANASTPTTASPSNASPQNAPGSSNVGTGPSPVPHPRPQDTTLRQSGGDGWLRRSTWGCVPMV